MLFTLATLTLALIGAVQTTPLVANLTPTIDAVSAADGVPVVSLDLGSVGPHGNVTVGADGTHVSSADAIYPATFFLCRLSGCGSCTGYDMSVLPHQTCLSGGFNFVSMFISQPSNAGLPYAVYTGPAGCASFAQVPIVNTCYNANNYIGWDFDFFP